MSSDQPRHTVRLDDRDIGIIELALRALASVQGIQTEAAGWDRDGQRKALQVAHTSARIQIHVHCGCGGEGG